MANLPNRSGERRTRSREALPTSQDAAVRQSWWRQLSPRARKTLIAGGVLSIALCCGESFSALSDSEPRATDAVSEVRTVVETEEVPFPKKVVADPSLPRGARKVRTKGVAGEREVVYRVTFVDGVETARERVSEEITKKPVAQVTAVGTGERPKPEQTWKPEALIKSEPEWKANPKQASKPDREKAPERACHPSYEGACVPFASDVDCEGGSGDGPAYARGPLRVVGPDVYDLDRDGDGIACDR